MTDFDLKEHLEQYEWAQPLLLHEINKRIEYLLTSNEKLRADYEALMSEAKIMREAIQWSYEMLRARDEMNSKVHCAPVRLSPITERVQMSLASFDAFIAKTENGES